MPATESHTTDHEGGLPDKYQACLGDADSEISMGRAPYKDKPADVS